MKCTKIIRETYGSGSNDWAWEHPSDLHGDNISSGWKVYVEYISGSQDWAELLNAIGKIIDETDHFPDLEFYVKPASTREILVITGPLDPMLFRLLTDYEPVFFDERLNDCP